jgi:hypothetical protein
MMMYQGCSGAEENQESCVKMATDNDWTTELQK